MHIFISYAKVDTFELASRLQAELQNLDHVTAWMDRDLETGASWASQIQREIQRADFVIVLLSKDVNRDPDGVKGRSFVLNEIDFAQQIDKPIIPIMAQKTYAPVQIAGIQFIDFVNDSNRGLQRLLQEINRRTGKRYAFPSDQISTVDPPVKPKKNRSPIVKIVIFLFVVSLFGSGFILFIVPELSNSFGSVIIPSPFETQTAEANNIATVRADAEFKLTLTQNAKTRLNVSPTPTPTQIKVTETLVYVSPVPTSTNSPILMIPGIDIIVVDVSPDTISRNEITDIRVTVLNQGREPAGKFTVAATFLPDSVYSGVTVQGLESGQMKTVNLQATLNGELGIYSVIIVADLNNEVFEGSDGEKNNVQYLYTYQVQ